jgi:hypothetical protein
VTGRCSYTTLQNFISTSIGIQNTNQQRLLTDSQDKTVVLKDSDVVLACANGYINTGGSLNVTCLGNGSWTQFPNCVSNTGSGSMTTTTISTSKGSPCMIDGATTFTIANGNYLSSSLAFASTTTATGRHIRL